jgi:hypothetical protein
MKILWRTTHRDGFTVLSGFLDARELPEVIQLVEFLGPAK